MPLNNLNDNDRRKGLKKARQVRKKRAEIKEQLKKGKTNLKSLFKNQKLITDYVSNMKVISLISALPGNGRVNALKILKELKISPNKKIGGLGRNQKENFYKFFKIT